MARSILLLGLKPADRGEKIGDGRPLNMPGDEYHPRDALALGPGT
jgi:hypothetical protein